MKVRRVLTLMLLTQHTELLSADLPPHPTTYLSVARISATPTLELTAPIGLQQTTSPRMVLHFLIFQRFHGTIRARVRFWLLTSATPRPMGRQGFATAPQAIMI